MRATRIDEALKQWATPRQIEIIDAVNREGSQQAAAYALGIDRSNVERALSAVRHKALLSQYVGSVSEEKPVIEREYRPVKSVRKDVDFSNSILVLPDQQIRPDIDLSFIYAQGRYVGHKRPSKVVGMGDFADMHSLSTYDRGTRRHEGSRYLNDIESVHTALSLFNHGIRDSLIEDGIDVKSYTPNMYMLLGNHEDRINRATNMDPKLFGSLSTDDLKYKEYGWEVIPFLEVLELDGISFSHYFKNNRSPKQTGFPSAQLQLLRNACSCIAGHKPGFEMATGYRPNGQRLISIIAGSSYDYDLEYMGPQGNKHWRGILMLHNVKDGEFDLVQIPVEYLAHKYLEDKKPMYFSPSTK